MKTINTKTFLFAVFACLLLISLLSSRAPQTGSNLEFLDYPYGIGIYNKETKTIYIYKSTLSVGLNPKPFSYKVSEDGSTISETK
jgi:hypothetical protein